MFNNQSRSSLREAVLTAQVKAALGNHHLSVFNLDSRQQAWHAICGQCGQMVSITTKGKIESTLADECETPIVPGT